MVNFQAVFRCLRIFPPLPGASDPGVVLKFILPLQELLLHCQLHNVAEIESSEVQCCLKIWSIPICILDPSHIFKGNEPTFRFKCQVTQHDKSMAMSRDAVAASVADVSACVVRVPCEARHKFQTFHNFRAPKIDPPGAIT